MYAAASNPKSTGTKRSARNAGERHGATSPATQTGTSTGETMTSWNGMKPIRPPSASPAMLPATVSCGQPWRCCQIRYGAPMARAMTMPSHSGLDRNTHRGPTSANETSATTATKATWGLASKPTPTTTPAQHSDHESWRTTARTSSHPSSDVANTSNVVVVTKWPVAKEIADTATTLAAIT